MRNKSWRFGTLLSVLLIALLALGGCGGAPHNTPGQTPNPSPNPSPNPNPNPNPQPQVGVLDGWKGEWKSYSSFTDTPEMKSIYKNIYDVVGKKSTSYTLEGVEGFFKNMLYTGPYFDGLEVKGDEVSFLDSSKNVLCKLKYKASGVQKQNAFGIEEYSMEWHLFEAVSAEAKSDAAQKTYLEGCRYLALVKPYKDNEGDESKTDVLRQCHIRFGVSLKATMAERLSTWRWPTLVDWSTSPADAAKNFEAIAKFMGEKIMPEKGPFEPWNGTWVNPISFLDDSAMTPVYEAVSKKAMENKKNYTPEAVKEAFKKMLGSDFTGGVKLEGNRATFMGGADETPVTYVFEGIKTQMFGTYPMQWSTFRSDAAAPYKCLVLLPAGQDSADGFTHFHMRYGDKSVEALLDTALQGWFPTLCEPGTTAAKFAHDMLEGADEMVEMLP